MSAIPEPPDGSIVCWFDRYNDPVCVFYRSDQHDEDGDQDHWYQSNGDGLLTWAELTAEAEGFRGPVELVSNGQIAPGHVFAGDDE